MRCKIQTTKPQQFINITDMVSNEVKNCNVRDGIAYICAPYNAGVTINENVDSMLCGT